MATHVKDDSGAAMVEFALILPILAMLLMGIIEFGRAYNMQITLQAAAREGARQAALGREPAVIEDKVRNAAQPHTLGPGAIDLSEASCPDSGAADAVVEVTKPFTFGIPFVDLGEVDISARGVMRCGV
jgi:Flp pilus assembly protein TadG